MLAMLAMLRPMLLVLLALLVVLAVGTSAAPSASSSQQDLAAPFHGHKVLRVVPSTGQQIRDLRQLLQEHVSLDPWLEPSDPGRPVDILYSPADDSLLNEFLRNHNLTANEMIGDLGRIIEGEQRQMLDAKRSSAEFGWDSYYTLDEIYKWMKSLVQKYPSEVSLIEVGRTFEGRTILGVKIKFSEEDKPIAFIEAGIHAREWITPATATYLINEILSRDEEEFNQAVRAYEWHIVPSTNPDGFVYTHTVNRMWRKSRSNYSYFCIGADLNRNWPFRWREIGSSRVPCSDTYAGVSAESETETKTIRRYLDSMIERPKNPVKVYISLHSYSQLLMFPWGWTNERAATHDDLNSIAGTAVRAAAKRYGTRFRFGPVATTIYPASGNTIDYAYKKGVKYPFVFELRDEGTYGFLLPKEQIRPTAEETVDSIVAIASEAAKRK